MRVYLAAAMTNPERNTSVVSRLLLHLEGAGHEVPSRHVASSDGPLAETATDDRELARRDLDWIAACDALIAEVSTPSHGVGVEVLWATLRGLPVLLLHAADAPVSRLLLGLSGVRAIAYRNPGEACAAIDRFLMTALKD